MYGAISNALYYYYLYLLIVMSRHYVSWLLCQHPALGIPVSQRCLHELTYLDCLSRLDADGGPRSWWRTPSPSLSLKHFDLQKVNIPANTRPWSSAGLLLARRLRRRTSNKPALDQRLVCPKILGFADGQSAAANISPNRIFHPNRGAMLGLHRWRRPGIVLSLDCISWLLKCLIAQMP